MSDTHTGTTEITDADALALPAGGAAVGDGVIEAAIAGAEL